MKLIFITPKFDADDIEVGYLHRWVEELAKHTKHIEVLCAHEGYHTLPEHVHVRSLGREKNAKFIKRTRRLLWHLFVMLFKGDTVLIHGNLTYPIIMGPLWRLMRKRVGVWYEDGDVSTKLAIAQPFLTHIFTPTSEALHMGGDKKQVVGHGIDVEMFRPLARPKHDGTFRIVTGGHMSVNKDYATLIRATALLSESIDTPFSVTIVGAAKPGSETYTKEMQTLVHSYGLGDTIIFRGPMKNADVVKLYRESDLYLSLYQLGRIEKSLVEATLTALPVVTSNEAFQEFAGDYNSFVFFEPGDETALADRIQHVMKMTNDARRTLGLSFRQIAVREHSIERLIRGIVLGFKNSPDV